MHFDLTDLRLYLNILDTGNITAGATRSHCPWQRPVRESAPWRRPWASACSNAADAVSPPRQPARPWRNMPGCCCNTPNTCNRIWPSTPKASKASTAVVQHHAMTEYLPELLAGFLKGHANLDIDLQELPSSRITHALRQGTADLGIVSDAVDTDGLQTWPFRDDPLVLILPSGHPLADGRALSFSETLSHDYVGLNASSALAIYLEEQALHTGLRMQIRIRADGFDGVIRMVAHGAGIAIVPKAAIARRPPEPAYQCVPLREAWAHRALLLCARNFEGLPAYAKALARHLAE